MPRKSRAKQPIAEDNGADIESSKSEVIQVEVVKEEIIKEETVKNDSVQNETSSSAAPTTIHIPFLSDNEEEIPTYVVEISKSARAIW